MRLPRVSAFLPEVIHWIQSRRASAVTSSQVAFAAGCAANAASRSGGTAGSGSSAYVPPEAKDDKQLQYALELLRGQKTDPAFPANPEKAELKQ